jgi:hypothetical protein
MAVLELGAGRAPRRPAGRHLDRLAGLRGAGLPWPALGDRDLAEAGDRHLAARRELPLDRLEQRYA